MSQLKGVLLDVDGTLVDSNDAHAKAWQQAMAESGIQADFAVIRRLIGKGGDKLLPEVTGLEEDTPQGKTISKRRGELFIEEFLPSLLPFPSAKELLWRMKQAGLRLAVASSSKKKELKGLLRVCEADDVIEASTSSDDAEESKPDPDIIQAALEKLALKPNEVILLGDTPYDLEAASRAGVKMVAVRSGGWGDKDFAGALAIYDDTADLLTHFEESPFVR